MKIKSSGWLPLAAVLMLLTGCGSQVADSPTPDGAVASESHDHEHDHDHEHGHVEGATEAEEPQIRISYLDNDSGMLTVLDAVTGDEVASFDGDPALRLSAADSRYIYLGDREGGSVSVLDTGVWSVEHGDHFHYYRAEPKDVGKVEGGKPAHVVSTDEIVTFFFDGDGEAQIYDRDSFGEDELIETGVITPGPHHGVAVPLGDHIISTVPDADSDNLPSNMAAYDQDGSSTPIEAECTETHGESVVAGSAYFACADGLLQVDADLSTTLIDYPGEVDGRAFSLVGGDDLIVAPIGESHAGIYNIGDASWNVIETKAEIVAVDLSADDSVLVVVDRSGNVSAIDPGSGDQMGSELIASAIESSESGQDPVPSIDVDLERTYLADPAAGVIYELDAADGLRVARTFEVGGSPAGVAVTGR